jgi:xanthine phosphoribosyltransferase
MSKLYYTWQDFEDDCRSLAGQIKEDKVEYKQIVAITRGGLFVAGLLSQFLELVPIETVSVHSYHGREQKEMKIIKGDTSKMPITFSPVIICDDVVDTGNTAELVKKMYPNSKMVSLHYKSKNSPSIKPDYFIEDTDKWIIYPWEINE